MSLEWTRDAAGVGGWQPEAGGGSSFATFSLTAQQIKDSMLTPHTIISAQGANTLIVPMAWVFAFTPGGTVYLGDSVDLVYGPNDLNVIFTGLSGSSAVDWYCFGTQSAGVSESGSPADMRNQPVKLAANIRGSIVAAAPGNGGTGYAVGDTGTIDDGSPLATYRVAAIGLLGAVTAITITSGGGGYSLAVSRSQTEWTTTPGGSQPGGGSGMVVNVTAVDASGAVGDGILRGVVYYEVVDLT